MQKILESVIDSFIGQALETLLHQTGHDYEDFALRLSPRSLVGQLHQHADRQHAAQASSSGSWAILHHSNGGGPVHSFIGGTSVRDTCCGDTPIRRRSEECHYHWP